LTAVEIAARDTTAASEALQGIRVLDLSDSVAGQFCGRLLADNGASTLLIEPPRGSRIRRTGPFKLDGPGQRRSTLFAHLNTGKSSVCIDRGDAADRQLLSELARRADVVIVDGEDRETSPFAPGSGPRVTCRISPFGSIGPLAGWRGSELVYQALSGVMYENGRPEGPPLFGVGHRASYAAGVIGYIESVAALLARPDVARLIDVAIAEVAASMSFNRVTQFSYNGEIEGRDIRTIPRAIVRCADGWVSIFIYDNRWRQACRGLGLDDLVDDPRFRDEASRLRHWPAFTAEIERRLATRTVDDVVAAGQRERAVVARALAPSELLTEKQLVARRFWDRKPKAGDLPRLGPMFRMHETPQQDHGGAPAAVGSGRAKAASWISAAAPPSSSSRPGIDRLPLDGVQVLDLTTAWSGPMATRILAALGASIVKVEGPGRIDDWRGPIGGGHSARYPDGIAGDRPYDRCYQFNTQNHDKRSLVVDLKTEAGLAIVLRLVDRSDVLIANFSAGTLDRIGLGWADVHPRNRRLILVEMPAYGVDGPISDHVALGPSMELMSGMARLIGYGDGRPVTTGPAYLDPIGGFNSAAAVLTALAARTHTGRGQSLELAQREAAMHWIGEEIVFAVATGADRAPRGNRVDGVVPHDAFRCAGEDEWVAIAAADDGEFRALVQAMGRPDLATDARFATLADRTIHEDALTAIIAAWTLPLDKHAVAASLQAAGVTAAPVNNASDLHASRYLRDRGLIQRVAHAAAGIHDYQGLPLHVSGWDLRIRSPSPRFGEHNAEVLTELGFDESAIADFEAAGVIAGHPR
jgi:crotonobetainyl-CoA:carnitine CoA-transferase CaiB-like acyl-CoA transferase